MELDRHARWEALVRGKAKAPIVPPATAQESAGPGVGKCPTGILGFDEILDGGLPRGRPTLLVGAAGCGKTVLAMEFLCRGIVDFGEPGVFIPFEERAGDLAANFAGLGFDLPALQSRNLLRVDHVEVERSQIQEAGEYDLDGLFVRLKAAIDAIGARRVVLDGVEVLFGALDNDDILRSELRRLFNWLKEQGMTTIVTAEQGVKAMTRHGLEEYVADCVILLQNAVDEGAAIRRMRVVKYRGSSHGANVYPFLIDRDGISVAPITSARLEYSVSSERISSGVPRLDALLGGGVFKGSGVLISGTAGCGKTSVAATFANAACGRGERVLYLAFEESCDQIVRNMTSIGLHLDEWMASGELEIISARPTMFGLEMHLAEIHRAVVRRNPSMVILDPISNFALTGSSRDVMALLARLVDLLKSRGTTAIFTSLTRGGEHLESTGAAVSSMMDTWLLLRDIEKEGERNRVLHVLKSRGSGHSHQVREFVLSDRGIDLLDVYAGPGGVALGSGRLVQEAEDRAGRLRRSLEIRRRERDRGRRLAVLNARIEALRAEFEASDQELGIELTEAQASDLAIEAIEREVSTYRKADTDHAPADPIPADPEEPAR